MAHYEVTGSIAAPKRTSKIADPEFIDTLVALEVGQGFSFPINTALKGPLSSRQSQAHANSADGTRHRWWIEDGVGFVKRIK